MNLVTGKSSVSKNWWEQHKTAVSACDADGADAGV